MGAADPLVERGDLELDQLVQQGRVEDDLVHFEAPLPAPDDPRLPPDLAPAIRSTSISEVPVPSPTLTTGASSSLSSSAIIARAASPA